jgi:hypothetical protein
MKIMLSNLFSEINRQDRLFFILIIIIKIAILKLEACNFFCNGVHKKTAIKKISG